MKKTKNIWILFPVAGILIFIILYISSAMIYPGGSYADKNAAGFSWINNYWCNLLNENAINGKYNPARPVALAGMFILCLSLVSFWFIFSLHMGFNKYSRLIIQLSGAITMMIAMFLFTAQHDTVINIAGFFGLIALSGTYAGLYKNKWYGLFWFGMLNLLLGGLNNYIYHTGTFIAYLPVIQKISFISFMLWICLVDVCLYRKIK